MRVIEALTIIIIIFNCDANRYKKKWEKSCTTISLTKRIEIKENILISCLLRFIILILKVTNRSLVSQTKNILGKFSLRNDDHKAK